MSLMALVQHPEIFKVLFLILKASIAPLNSAQEHQLMAMALFIEDQVLRFIADL